MNNLNLKKQMPKNLIMNLFSFIVNVFIGLWIIPYLVNHMGVVAYGLVPLAMVFSEYVSVIVQSLNTSISRFLLMALQKNDYVEANKIFNTSLIIILVFIFIQMIIAAVVILNLSYLINIPSALIDDALWLFSLTFISFFFSLMRGVFEAPIFAHNRLDITNIINITQILSRAGMVIFLFSFNEPRLMHVGIANLCAELLVIAVTLYYSRKFAPQLHIDLSLFDKNRVSELSKMGGWVLINQIGSLLFLKIDLLIANKFLGVAVAGEYAIVLQWNSLVRVFAGVLSGVLSPLVMIFYARGEQDKLIEMLLVSIKLMAIGMSILVGVLTALSGDILVVWVGEDFRYLGQLMLFSLLPLVINLSVYPLFAIQIAFNKIKIPGIVTLVLGAVNFFLAILLVKHTELGLYGIILAGAIVLTFKNAFFTPMYAASILNISSFSFMKYHILGISFYSITYMVTSTIASHYQIDTWMTLVWIVTMSLSSAIIVFYLYLKFDQKLSLQISQIIRKKGRA